jgi:hypothetical protein
VSEVLSGKRPLTLAMIRRLHDAMGIPADILIAEPAKRRRRVARPTVARSARSAPHRRSA